MIYHRDNDGNRGWRRDPYDLIDLERTIRKTTKILRPHLDKFDSIIATGLSGVIVGTPVALRLKKPLVVLRKRDDGSHHLSFVGDEEFVFLNADSIGKRTLFLDDFISAGNTRDRVRDAVKSQKAKIVGTYLYRDGDLLGSVSR